MTAKAKGEVVVVATAKDTDVSAYSHINIINGYFVDEIEDFSKMYQYGEFAFDDPKSLIKQGLKDYQIVIKVLFML